MAAKDKSEETSENTISANGEKLRKSQKSGRAPQLTPISREENPSSPLCPPALEPDGSGGSKVARRNRRLTTSLTAANVCLIKRGVHHSQRIGLPVNRMMTVDWDLGGVADAQVARERLLKLIYDWIRCRGHETAWVWVMEHGRKHGMHSHILIHVPPTLKKELNRRMRGWRKAAGLSWKKGVMNSRPIGYSERAALLQGIEGGVYQVNLVRTCQYITKAADAAARRLYGITSFRQYSVVEGKRCGTSRNVGAAAIKRWKESGLGSRQR